MTNHLFAGSLHRTQIDMLDAIAHNWVTSRGRASLEEVRDILLAASDDDLAVDCITEWELGRPDWIPAGAARVSHMERYGYEASDLEAAFARFRADINHDLDVIARGDGEMHEPW